MPTDEPNPREARSRGEGGRGRAGGQRSQRSNRADSPRKRVERSDRGHARSGGKRPRVAERPSQEEKTHRPGTAPRPDEPETPTDFVEAELPFGVRAELKGLPKDLADTVGAHIWAAGRLIDMDPELAFRHAEAARRRAGRLPVVREAAAETAYAAGEYAVALREFRAIRRMTGGDELIPVIADCERALGRPRDALAVLAELDSTSRDLGLRIECLIVEAGIRDDLGQGTEARRLLKAAITRNLGPKQAQARLRYAYANYLEEDGDRAAAREWFASAASLDPHGELDTADRLALLDGVTLPEDMSGEAPETPGGTQE